MNNFSRTFLTLFTILSLLSCPFLLTTASAGEHSIDYQQILKKTHSNLHDAFHDMHEHIEIAEEKLSDVGIDSDESQKILEELCQNTQHAYDCSLINTEGVIIKIAPEKESNFIGTDISSQEQVSRLHETKKPVVSKAIDAVEGFVSFDFEHPLFSPDGTFIGSVSILTKPHFFGSIIEPAIEQYPVEMWVMQTDGVIIYDPNEEEVGKNLFTDELYAEYPSLQKIGKQMAETKKGSGQYSFFSKNMDETVSKNLLWTTVELHGTAFRIALAYTDNQPEKKKDMSLFTIGSGKVTGVFFPVAGAIAQVINSEKFENSFKAAVIPSSGSVNNISTVLNGEGELGISQSDIQYQAYHGTGKWKSQGKQENLRSICSLYIEKITLIANSDSQISSIADLKNSSVSLGELGSGTLQNTREILEAFDITEDQLKAFYLPSNKALQELKNKKIDAFFVTMGHPNQVISRASSNPQTTRLIPINNDAIHAMIANYPFYTKTTISVADYPDLINTEDCITLGIPSVLITSSSVPDEKIYAITKSIFENLDQLKKLHPVLSKLNKEDMLKGLSAPLHPGALKYLEEVGLK